MLEQVSLGDPELSQDIHSLKLSLKLFKALFKLLAFLCLAKAAQEAKLKIVKGQLQLQTETHVIFLLLSLTVFWISDGGFWIIFIVIVSLLTHSVPCLSLRTVVEK